MNFDFEQVPEFFQNEPISASDLNILTKNNVTLSNVVNSPQPLFMSAHAYAPTVMPVDWHSNYFDIWKGAFLYRTGMTTAHLGLLIKLESLFDGLADAMNQSMFGNIKLAVFIKYTNKTYDELKAGSFSSYVGIGSINASGYNDGGFYYNMKNGQTTSGSTIDGAGGSFERIRSNSRVSNVDINLNTFDFLDGEVVEVKLQLLVPSSFNQTISQTIRATGLIGRKSSIYYSMLYANVEGTSVLASSWPVASFVSSGNAVLSVSNLKILTDKQNYLVTKLKNRSFPLTGSILYWGVLGGTASNRYTETDFLLADALAYGIPTSHTEAVYPYSDSQTRTNYFNLAVPYNMQNTLATFAWNPYFTRYDSFYLNFKFYGNTAVRQFFMVDLPQVPVSMTSIRKNYFTERATGAFNWSYNLGGGPYLEYIPAVNGAPETYKSTQVTGPYHSVYVDHSTAKHVTNSTLNKVYKNHMYNIRIPSPTTTVFSPELNISSADVPASKFYLTKGLWEGSTQIKFTQTTVTGNLIAWNLLKGASSGQTIQLGLAGEVSESVVQGLYPIIFTTFTVPESVLQYETVATYNSSTTWNWVSTDGLVGWTNAFINLYDHSSVGGTLKASYISLTQVQSATVGNSLANVYSKPTEYSPNTLLLYSTLIQKLSELNSELDALYTELETNNPYLYRENFFWNKPFSPLTLETLDNKPFEGVTKKTADALFYFHRKRIGNFLLVRGKDVTLHHGDLTTIDRKEGPSGSLIKPDTYTVSFEKSVTVISGDNEQTVLFNLDGVDGLTYSQPYYLKGANIVYAAEFFEEPI
jgi:hypothetical protein